MRIGDYLQEIAQRTGQQSIAIPLHRAEGVMPDGEGGVIHWRDTGDGIEYTPRRPRRVRGGARRALIA